jgi:nucleotide-binding universal stress UspA family protein
MMTQPESVAADAWTLDRILVPLDGSLVAEQALPYAETLARAAGAGVVLVRAVSSEPPWAGDAVEGRLRAAGEAADYLAATAERLRGSGLQVETAAPHGEPAEAVAKELGARGADLVVMSTHGRSGLGRWVYGSVAESILRRTPTPTLLVRAWREDGDYGDLAHEPRVLVPLDGSEFAEEALRVARSLAATLGGGLVLARAVYPPSAVEQEWTVASYLVEELRERESDAREYLAGVADRLRAAGAEPETCVYVGPPVEVIARAAREQAATLIVMATHGRTGAGRLLLGSVANSVLLHNDLPLVLMRPRAVGAGGRARPRG